MSPNSPEMSSYSLDDLLLLMERLRDPVDGCPWDKAQSFQSIVPHTLEECYELADAIENENTDQVIEELGDVLFQIVFYAQLGRENRQFNLDKIITILVEKLLRRHPHVFPDGSLQSRALDNDLDSEEISRNWEKIKTHERRNKHQFSILDDIPASLPALTRAFKLQKRVARVGFDYGDIDSVLTSLQSEINELIEARKTLSVEDIESELGDVLFSVVNLARHLKIDPESAVRKTNKKFDARFRYIEERLLAAGKTTEDADLDLMDRLWDDAKSRGL